MMSCSPIGRLAIVSDAVLPSGPLRSGEVPSTTPSRWNTTTPDGAALPVAVVTKAVNLIAVPTVVDEREVMTVVKVWTLPAGWASSSAPD